MITSEQANNNQKLYKQTLVRLGEMLKILKEGDSNRNRENIKSHCDYLSNQGKKQNLFGWVEVMETAKAAIVKTENDYNSTAKLIIKEIKNAGEYLVKNEINAICLTDELRQLAPNSRARLMDVETIFADMRDQIPQEDVYHQKTTIERDLWRETQIGFNAPSLEQFEEEKNNNTPEISSDDSDIFHQLSISDDDGLLDEWLDDDSFDDENQQVSAVFLREEDLITNIGNPDTAKEISHVFEGQDDHNLNIDQWHTDNTTENNIDNEDSSAEWEFLSDEDENPSDNNQLLSPLEHDYKSTVIQEDFDVDNWDNLFDDLARNTVIIDDPQEEFKNILNNFDDLEIEDDFPSTGTFNTFQILHPVKSSLIPVVFYDEFEELGSLLQSSFPWWGEDSFEDLESIINNCVINYYEDHSDLERLVNSSHKHLEEVNWQHLFNVIEDIPEGQFAQHKIKTFVPENQPSIDAQLSDLDQLLAEAGTIKRKPQKWTPPVNKGTNNNQAKTFEQSMRVPVKQLDNLNNLIGEMVVRRNRLEEDQDKLRQFLDNLLSHVQNLSEVGVKMQDTYEKSLMEGALIDSRRRNEATVKAQLARAQNRSGSTYIGDGTQNKNGNNIENTLFQLPELDELDLDRFTGFHLLAQDILELIVRVRESTSDIQFLVDETDQLGRNLRQVTTQLQEEINKSRMVSFAQNADRLPLPIRKIAQGYDKQVQLKIEGREVLIDKMILEHLWDPLLQITKNCITHGIELPQEREEIGKSPIGTITVRAFLQGPQTVISITDDGAGIDTQKIKRKAIQNKLITPEQAKNLKDQETYDFLFNAGFTTKEQADSHAGRGVGLDIVRTKLNEIRGSVTVDSIPGQGTTFTIRLPLTLSIGKALCCMNDNARIAFPIDGIEDTKDYAASDIKINAQGQKCILWKKTLLPFRPLSTLMNYNRQITRSIIYTNNQDEETIPIVILRGGNNLLAIQVDQVLGQEEIVIKQISGPLPKPKGIAGATVRSDGIVMAIGDVIELIEIAQGNLSTKVHVDMPERFYSENTIQETVKTQPLVLIVDDSITVREMLSISFKKSNYRVEQARDGQEAWQKLQSGLPCDIVFCDIEMPRMNGLELLQHMQEDKDLAHIPVAILSSRGAEKHQRIAAELGASAYLIKPYVEKDLIDSAKRMVGGEVLLVGSTKKPSVKVRKSNLSPQQENTSNVKQKLKSSPMVLIIDDSVVVREMLSMTFKKAGYQVEQARDGQDAWDKIIEGLPCDLLLCDIEMPRMNGLELLAKMQQDEKLSKLPVAMVTSRGAEKHRKIAADLGAKAYFTKPYLEEELLNAAQKLIKGETIN